MNDQKQICRRHLFCCECGAIHPHNIEEYLNFNTALPKQKTIDEIKERRRDRVSKSRKETLNTQEDLNAVKNIRIGFDDINMAFVNRFKSFCATFL